MNVLEQQGLKSSGLMTLMQLVYFQDKLQVIWLLDITYYVTNYK